MNYNQLASDNTKIERICHTMAADTQNKLHRRHHELQLHPPHQQICANKIRHRAYHWNGGTKVMAQPCATTPPPHERQQKPHPPRANAHQGAGNGTNHDPGHGGVA